MHCFDVPCTFAVQAIHAVDTMTALEVAGENLIFETVGDQIQSFRIILTTPEGILKDLTTVDDRSINYYYKTVWARPHTLRSRAKEDYSKDRLDPIWIRLWREFIVDTRLRNHLYGCDYVRTLEEFEREYPGAPEAKVKTALGRIRQALTKGERKLRDLKFRGLRRRLFSLPRKPSFHTILH